MKEMSRNKLYVPIVFFFIFGIAGCGIQRSSRRNAGSYFDKNYPEPRIIQLGPDDCPWDQTYIIKNSRKHNEYGRAYAKKQNRKLDDAL